jgi:hypothetical protein
MKQVLSGYKGTHKSMFIVPIGDIHFGNKYFDEAKLKDALNFVDKNRNRCRIVLMGDLLELATKTSVGRSVYDENYPTQKQFEIAVETFKPYADLIDCIVEGNHEERIIRDTSFEITEELSHRLNRHDAYCKFQGMVNVNTGDGLTYSIHAWHGATGGTKETSVINGLLSMREVSMSHVYMMGHTHKLFAFNKKITLPQPGSDQCAELDQLFVNTGTAVGNGGYGEQKGYAMNRTGFGAVQLFADKRKAVFHAIDDLVA